MRRKLLLSGWLALVLLAGAVSSAQAKLGQLLVKCTPAAFLLIDGQSISPKPLKKITVGVEPGKHILTTYNVDYVEEDWEIRIYPGKLTTMELVLLKAGQDRDEMIAIPGGSFEMGVDAKRAEWMSKRLKVSPGRLLDQQPAHTVTLKPFKIDKYEVTNRQYAEFVKATKRKPPKHWRYGDYPKDEADYPVVNVSWHDAAAYAKWAGKRLPTEAEWEMAARDGGIRIFPWGQVFRQNRANTKGSGFDGPTVTGRYQKGASKNGGCDFSGNVAEWTASWYEAYPGQKLDDPAAGAGTHRVVRGGSWRSTPAQATAVARDKLPPDGVFDYVGFRCVR